MARSRPLLRRILVPTDFSDPSRRAADYATRLARTFGSEVFLLFVEGPFTYGFSGDLLASSAAVEFFERNRRQTRAALLRLGRHLRRRNVRCRTLHATGAVAPRIAEVAKRMRADLIVMGTHGRTGLSHLMLGSIAESVVRLARCPVMTLRSVKTRRVARRERVRAPRTP
jgi:universal stress protein A